MVVGSQVTKSRNAMLWKVQFLVTWLLMVTWNLLVTDVAWLRCPGLSPSTVSVPHPNLGYAQSEVTVIRRVVQMDMMQPLAITSHHE
jgi:hypothetical protein